ncbi:unnamed protein product [Amoebophrya sp. A120]|nr:unnamed protein product [Amoebophrya sp. A120]|eukprot:GSA120T00023049001.1
MEKYRQFADQTKGVNPFVPVWANRRIPWWHKVTKFLLIFPLVLPVRIVGFVLGFLALVLAWVLLGAVHILSGYLHDLLACLLLPPVCRLCLFSLGFHWIDYGRTTDPRRLRLRTAASSGDKTGRKGNTNVEDQAQHGRLLVCNAQGPCDVLYFGLFGYNSFCFTHSSTARVELSRGIIPAFLRAAEIYGERLPEDAYLSAATDLSRPTVLFAEGARTNGTCVLPLTGISALLNGNVSSGGALASRRASAGSRSTTISRGPKITLNAEAGKVSVATVIYPSKSTELFTPSLTTTTSIISYLLQLQYQWRHTVASHWLPAELVALNIASSSMGGSGSGDGTEEVEGKNEEAPVAEKLRFWLATMPSPVLHEVANNATDLIEFHRYWTDTQKKKYT